MSIANTVLNTLREHHIDYGIVTHPRAYTSSKVADTTRVRDDHIAKGVLLEDEKGYVLTVIPADHWIDFHRLEMEFGRKVHVTIRPTSVRGHGEVISEKKYTVG